ncbi:MAG TPA: hypothetical protein VFS55_01780 [Dokdonella sp.]|nr:hypothetical protein [Dokdonella sp.]
MSQPYRAPAGALLLALAGTFAAPASAEPPRLWQPGDAMHYPGLVRHAQPMPAAALDPAGLVATTSAWIEQRVVAADGGAGDLYGFRVLVAGDTAFVSAPAPLARSGAVYVYHFDGANWVETQRITATQSPSAPPNWSDFFGWSLSLSSSGDRLLVGAPEMFNPMFGPAGGAYLFARGGDGTWSQVQDFASPAPLTLTWFGRAVALAGDVVLVGEPSYNMSTEGGRGAVHAFAESGGSWSLVQTIRASDGQNMDDHFFGGAIASDGTTVVVGAPGADYSSSGAYPTGSVYVYGNAGGTFTEMQKLQADDGADGDQFGYAVALSGTQLLVGAPAATIAANVHQGAAYVFDGSGASFEQAQKLVDDAGVAYDQFGQSVAMRGGVALVGMWSYNDEPGGTPPPPKAGHVALFTADGTTWSLAQTLNGGHGSEGDSYGWDVATDGATLLVGADADGSIAQYQGAAYFYANDTVFADGFDG